MEKENIENEQVKEEKQETKKMKKNKHNEELQKLLEQVKTFEEETLRAKADLINYRKRKDEEVSNLLKYANADIIISLLPVLDNFERVLNKEVENEELKT